MRSGQKAEERVAKWLKKHSYTIQERNWKTRFCEIDIVALKHDSIYFVEVKYRTHPSQGRGVDYITPTKLTQMEKAASIYLFEENIELSPQLAVASVAKDFVIEDFILI